MKIYIDEEFNVCEGSRLRVSRGDLLALEVVLPVSVGTFLEVRFGGKVSHDGEFIVYSYATGVSGEFTLSLNLNAEALQSALGSEACLVIPCELEFRREGEVQTARGIKLKVDQDIVKGSEVMPSEIPGVASISEDGFWVVSGVKTLFRAVPDAPEAPQVPDKWTIGDNGNWFLNGVDQGRRAVANDPDWSNPPDNVDYVVESFVSPDKSKWYRKYKSGWLEQGGRIPMQINSVALLYPFVDTSFTVFIAYESSDINSMVSVGAISGFSKSVSSFKVISSSLSSRVWRAEGFAGVRA